MDVMKMQLARMGVLFRDSVSGVPETADGTDLFVPTINPSNGEMTGLAAGLAALGNIPTVSVDPVTGRSIISAGAAVVINAAQSEPVAAVLSRPASAIAALYQSATNAVPSMSAPTQPALPAAVGTNYYIDNLHPAASDANAGTSPDLPWANVTKLIGRATTAGDVYNLAADCIWSYAETVAAPSAHFSYNGCDNLKGASGNPVIIRPYYPRATTRKPTIAAWVETVASDWTNETGIGPNVWSCARTQADKRRYVLRTGANLETACRAHDGTVGDTSKVDGPNRFTGLNNKLYLYSVGNPISYYGRVAYTGLVIFSSYYDGLKYVTIDGIRFEYCFAAIAKWGASSGTYAGLTIQNCESYRMALCDINNAQTNATPAEMQVLIDNNKLIETSISGIHLATSGGTSGNSINWEIKRNRVYGGNYSQSYGGGLLYNQALGSTKYIAHHNYGFDCRNASGGENMDGCFIYNDVGTNHAVVTQNIAEQCALPYQGNSCKDVHVIDNLAIDCRMLHFTSDGSNSGAAATVAQNTWLHTGRVDIAALQHGAGITNAPIIDVWRGSSVQLAQVAHINNLMISMPGTALAGIRYTSAHITSLLNSGNAFVGISGTPVLDAGTPVSSGIAFIGSSGSAILPGGTVGVAVPAPDAAIAGCCAALSAQYVDILGRSHGVRATPGCYEINT